MALSRSFTARGAVVAVALAAALTPASASAAAGRSCDTGGSRHVYSLTSFRGAPCGSALVISHRLGSRYSRPSAFRGGNSSATITQKDGIGRKYSCHWQSGSSRNDIVLWGCKRGRTVVTWIWRFEAL